MLKTTSDCAWSPFSPVLEVECFTLTSVALGLLVTFKTQTGYQRWLVESRGILLWIIRHEWYSLQLHIPSAVHDLTGNHVKTFLLILRFKQLECQRLKDAGFLQLPRFTEGRSLWGLLINVWLTCDVELVDLSWSVACFHFFLCSLFGLPP